MADAPFDDSARADVFLKYVHNIPKLTGCDNFFVWCGQVLECAGLFGISKCLSQEGDWGIFEKYARVLITASVSPDILQLLHLKGLSSETTSSEAFFMLYGIFCSIDEVEKNEVTMRLAGLDASRYDSLWAYIVEANQLKLQVALLGGRDRMENLTYWVIRGLAISTGPNREMWDRYPLHTEQRRAPSLREVMKHLERLARAQSLSHGRFETSIR